MNIDLSPIIQAIIGLLAALITARLIPFIKEKTSNEQRQRMAAAIRVAAFAAEQIFGAGHGAEKMDYALAYLRDMGFLVDSREIEAAVYQYFNLPKMLNELVEDTEQKPPDTEEKISGWNTPEEV